MHFLLSALHVMFSCILSSGLAAPTGETPSASTAKSSSSHVRTKRCSCATFLDKECVYFCHLDIIWVNTPERVVSYGLGNAPRTKRSSPDAMATGVGPRCRCLRENDRTCTNYCLRDNLHRYESGTHREIRSADGDSCSGAKCKQKLSADNIKSDLKQVSAPALRAVLRTRMLLEKWRMRRRRRAS